jgi:formylglycine-generating enzyme required for sulfatase activity
VKSPPEYEENMRHKKDFHRTLHSNSLSWQDFLKIVMAVGAASLLAVGCRPVASVPEPTEAPTPTPTETVPPLGFPGNLVTANDQWTPVTRELDGVPMALVPAGCFMMGSTPEQIDAAIQSCTRLAGKEVCPADVYNVEGPQHQVCFAAPFWIDVTEVTNARYGSSGKWGGDDLPRESVTWFEATAFCESRAARLPSEAEWEYAARGPDGWLYPWGNAFDGSSLNACDKDCAYRWADRSVDDGYDFTAPVGSYSKGVSWVGALDMSGNVTEWTSSILKPYPYNPADGREASGGQDRSSRRVLRGGSWLGSQVDMRATFRNTAYPTTSGENIGFRCVRSYDSDDARP